MVEYPLRIAHRGDSGNCIENTIESFTSAINKGADWIELDVQWVHDSFVVFHDRNLFRVAKIQKSIDDLTLHELLALDLGNGNTIPTLQNAASVIRGKAKLNIELKGFIPSRAIANGVNTLLTQGWIASDLLLSSFNHQLLSSLKDLLPDIPRAPILYGYPLDGVSTAKRLDATTVVIDLHLINSERVDEFHAHNIKVFVFTVNELVDIDVVKRLGVDGIVTNYPERI